MAFFPAVLFAAAIAARFEAARAVALSHSSGTIDSATAVLTVGSKAWTNKPYTHERLPSDLVGATFWPGLGFATCPQGDLTLGPFTSAGTVFVWYEDRGDYDGGLFQLEDSGWGLFDFNGSLSWTWWRSAVIYAKEVRAQSTLTIPITGTWAGGLAFTEQIVVIPASRFRLEWHGPKFDTAPRRMEFGRKVFHQNDPYNRVWATSLPDVDMDPVFYSAHYWPGIKRNELWGNDVEFFTSVAGMFFAIDWDGQYAGHFDGLTDWEFLGLIRPTAAYVYSRDVAADAAVRVTPMSRIRMSFAFKEGLHIAQVWNKTADILQAKRMAATPEVDAMLSHPNQLHGELTTMAEWHVGARPWASKDWAIVSMPQHLVGAACFRPSHPRGYGPAANLLFETFTAGSLLMWHAGSWSSHDDSSNGAHRLDDDPSSGWSLVGSMIVQSAVEEHKYEVMVYGKAVRAGAVERVLQQGLWSGGLAFVRNASLAAVRFAFALNDVEGKHFDDVPRRFGPFAVAFTNRGYYYKHVFSGALQNGNMFGVFFDQTISQSYRFTTTVTGTLFLWQRAHFIPGNDASGIEEVWLWMQSQRHAGWYLGIGMALEWYNRRYALFGAMMDAGSSVVFSPSNKVEGSIGFSTAFNVTAANLLSADAPARWTHKHWYVEHSGVLQVGAQAWTSEPNVYETVPEEMRGIMYWPSLEGHLYVPCGTLQLTTSMGGAVFAWFKELGGTETEFDRVADGWRFFRDDLCVTPLKGDTLPYCFIVYARNLSGPSVVDFPYSNRWRGGAGFSTTAVSFPSERPFTLTHSSFSFDGVPRLLHAGALAWTSASAAYTEAMPAALEGAWFWPGLPRVLDQVGKMTFATAARGTLFVWGRADARTGGLQALASEGWSLNQTALATDDGVAFPMLYSKAVLSESWTSISITAVWEGGVAFRKAPRITTTTTTTSTTSLSTTSTTSTTSTPTSTTTSLSTTSTPASTTTSLLTSARTSSASTLMEAAPAPAADPTAQCCTKVSASFAREHRVVKCKKAP